MIPRLSKHVTSSKTFDPAPKSIEDVAKSMMDVARRYAKKHNIHAGELAANCACMIIASQISGMDKENAYAFISYIENYAIKEGLENRVDEEAA